MLLKWAIGGAIVGVIVGIIWFDGSIWSSAVFGAIIAVTLRKAIFRNLWM
jgi:hypothetical protein